MAAGAWVSSAGAGCTAGVSSSVLSSGVVGWTFSGWVVTSVLLAGTEMVAAGGSTGGVAVWPHAAISPKTIAAIAAPLIQGRFQRLRGRAGPAGGGVGELGNARLAFVLAGSGVAGQARDA